MPQLNYDAAQVKEDDREPLPAGTYPVTVRETTLETTKKGDGQYIRVQYQVADGPFKGRVVGNNYNVNNPNPDAERIGRQQLKRAMVACGCGEANNTDAMHGRHLLIEVELDGTYNNVVGHQEASSVYQTTSAPAPAAQAAPQSPKAPWEK